MGWGAARSQAISSRTRRCAAVVRANGSAASTLVQLQPGAPAACAGAGSGAQAGALALAVLRQLLRQQLLGLQALPGRVAVILQRCQRHVR